MQTLLEVFNIEQKLFVTDSLTGENYNRVFPIFEDESIFFARNLLIRKNDSVIDLGCGSGILSVFAAQKAKKVHAVDVNERALKFASFNAHLNGVDKKIDFIKSDLFNNIKEKYDLILLNPPFGIAPEKIKGALFSDGGTDGLRITRLVLSSIKDYINPKARFQLITLSPGKNGKPIILEEIYRYLGNDIAIEYRNLYPKIKLSYFLFKVFGNAFPEFIKKLLGQYTEYYYLFITVTFDPEKSYIKELPSPSFKETRFSGSWKARINRKRAILGFS